MTQSNEKTIFIVGPTATGKTSLALKLCKEFNGEIISADSRQVYKYMDIGTGKDIKKFKINPPIRRAKLKIKLNGKIREISCYQENNIKIWLYDVVKPDEEFSVAHYLKVFKPVYEDIISRRKTPFVVGGAGFYVSALLNPPETVNIPQDKSLRQELSTLPMEELQKSLKALNEERFNKMNVSDRQNPRRLVRAIEAASFIVEGRVLLRAQPLSTTPLIIGLRGNKEILQKRIDIRIQTRLDDGLLDEIKDLLNKGYHWTDPGMNSLGYKEWREYFEGKKSRKEVVERWKFDEYDYVRRQMTWFKKMKNIHWLDITDQSLIRKASEIIMGTS